MKWALLLALVAGCDPYWELTTHVTDPDGDAIENASLALTHCQGDGAELPGRSSLSDANGDASLADLGTQFPPCDITVAAPGFASFHSSFDELCDHHLDDCERVQTIEVVLE